MKPPNIVFILIDDMGWKDLVCYGSPFYETPNIDRLAREGMRFSDAYAACPVCSPTRSRNPVFYTHLTLPTSPSAYNSQVVVLFKHHIIHQTNSAQFTIDDRPDSILISHTDAAED